MYYTNRFKQKWVSSSIKFFFKYFLLTMQVKLNYQKNIAARPVHNFLFRWIEELDQLINNKVLNI